MGRVLRKRMRITEDISSDASSALKYMAFIDAGSFIKSGNGLMSQILKGLSPGDISTWFRETSSSETYKENVDKFDAISSRFGASPFLRTLYIAARKVMEKLAAGEDVEKSSGDLEIVLKKIQKQIIENLTDDELAIFGGISDELETVASNFADKFNERLTPVEEPEEKEEEEEESPETKDTATDSGKEKTTEPKSDTTSTQPAVSKKETPSTKTTQEQLEKRIKSIVREILQQKIKSKRNKK